MIGDFVVLGKGVNHGSSALYFDDDVIVPVVDKSNLSTCKIEKNAGVNGALRAINANGAIILEAASFWAYAANGISISLDQYTKNFCGIGGAKLGADGSDATQTTSKTTNVMAANSRSSGVVVTSNAALAAGATVAFKVVMNRAKTSDVIIVSAPAIANVKCYEVDAWPDSADGAFWVSLKNITAASRSEAVRIGFLMLTPKNV